MKIRLWKGYHSPKLFELVRETWENRDLLILCPPLLRDLQFVSLLPSGLPRGIEEEIEFYGDWDLSEQERQEAVRLYRPAAIPYPELPVLGVFSSGTVSGSPRLILYSKRNIEVSLNGILNLFEKNRIKRIFCYPQPFHTFGLLLGYVLSHLSGFELIAATGKYSSLAHQLRLARDSEDMLTLGTPTHLHDLIQFKRSKSEKALRSYTCILGGASVSVDLWKQMRNELGIQEPSIGYGATEASPGITHLPPGQEPLEDGEVGYPLRHLEVRIEPGRGIEVRGESVCLAIIQGGRLEFPDRLLVEDWIEARNDGVLQYRGRYGLILNRGGEKFPLELLEHRIQSDLGIETVCMGIPHPRLGEDLAILMKATDRNSEIEARVKIREFLRDVWGIDFDLDRFMAVEEFPFNSSSKLDRKKALKTVLTPRFPISVQALEKWVPHRAPMVWVDQVLSVTPQGGECLVQLKEDALYRSGEGIRQSSLIEWLAQGFAYVRATQHLFGMLPPAPQPSRVFLVGVRDAKFLVPMNPLQLSGSSFLRIQVGNVKEVSPLLLFEGSVLSQDGTRIFDAKIKVYSAASLMNGLEIREK